MEQTDSTAQTSTDIEPESRPDGLTVRFVDGSNPDERGRAGGPDVGTGHMTHRPRDIGRIPQVLQ